MPQKSDKVKLFYKIDQLLVRGLFRALYNLKVIGKENIPQTGPFILASNHQSWFDPPILGSSCPREIFFAAKKELFDKPILGALVRYHNSIPVKRTGFDRKLLFLMGKALENGYGVAIFPEGTRFLDGRLRPPKPGVGIIALKSLAPVIPTYVMGSANLRKQILKRGLTIRFGSPFKLDPKKYEELDEKTAYREASKVVMRKIAETGGVEAPV